MARTVRRPGPTSTLSQILAAAASCFAVTSEHAAGLFRRFLAERVLGEIAARLDAGRPELRAALVASQLVGLAVARYAVRLAPLTAAGADELVRWAGPVLQYYLTGTEPAPKEEQ